MKRLLKKIIPQKALSSLMPLRFCCRDRAAWFDKVWHRREVELKLSAASEYASPIDATIGIIRDPMCVHQYYVYACREMKVAYRLYDIFSAGWYEDIVRDTLVDAFVIAPRIQNSAWRQMYDERLRIIVESGKTIFPTYDELWMYESKRRMSYWLKHNGFDAPGTYIFYSYSEALEFARNAELPIVVKIDMGYGARGVRIFRTKARLVGYVKRCFNKRVRLHIGGYSPVIENGYVLFQEYVDTPLECRLVRIGDSYFAHQKVRVGKFHSGSHKKSWIPPERRHLDLVKRVTDRGGFKSMNVDLLEGPDGRLLINELQALPGVRYPYLTVVNGRPGRYVYDAERDDWRFEVGDFCQNLLCNLRIQSVLADLGYTVGLPAGAPDKIVSSEHAETSRRDYRLRGSAESDGLG